MTEKYPKLIRQVYEDKALSVTLKYMSIVSVAVSITALLFFLACHIQDGVFFAVRVLLALGVPFVLVSVLRAFLNLPRPYEVFDLPTIKKGAKAGRSFPSRHVFSSFAIGTLLLFYLLPFGILVLIAGAVLAVCRVLLGIHFPRDAVAGALLGILSSVIGYFVIFI